MFRKLRRLGGDDRGSALFSVIVLSIVMATVLAALSASSVTRSRVAERSNNELGRLYAAQAGLDRMKAFIMVDAGTAAPRLQSEIGAGGDVNAIHTLDVGGRVVETFAEDLHTSPDPYLTWYLLRARATDEQGRVTEIGLACRLVDSFAKYALFVDGNLSIGDFARYAGNVHANGTVTISGHHVTFLGDLTAMRDIVFGNSNARNTVTFAKSAISGVPYKPRPSAADIEETGSNPPEGALVFDWNNAVFKTKFRTATGVYPNNTLNSYLTFQGDEITVQHVCTVSGSTKTMTETVDIPNNNIIYSAGDVWFEGHLSRRTSIITPRNLHVTGPVRYVDDSDEAQYLLYKKAGGVAEFDDALDTWKPVTNWKSSNFDYRQADDWADRMPVVDGTPQNPTLGLVAGRSIYIENADKDFPKNVEVHAMMYSAEDVVRPRETSDPNGHNLYLFGGRVQVGSSPNSGAWQFRHYIYDENLAANPPPGFPSSLDPGFSNWHVRQSQ
ncbi:MAG: hypothetical protein JW909_05310 [Planctomycetes bacterium]|nr:hypothetical protein [Planctomycetota bacterium]